MKVSIIIPVYNAEEYLERCLNSIINQVYKNIEIIIIDDCSTDNSRNIIKRYAQADSRVISIYSDVNKGVSSARNIGLNVYTGEYVIFVDSDDELRKDAIRRMIDAANRYDSDFIDNYHLLIYNKKNKIYKFTEKKVPKKNLVLGNINENNKIIDMYTYITGKLIKKDLLKDLYFDEKLKRYEDLVFEHQLKLRIKNYVMLNRPIYLYYQREDSLVNGYGDKHLLFYEALKEAKKVYKNCDKNVVDKIDALLFTNMIMTLLFKAKVDVKTTIKYINLTIDEIPNYNENKKINKILKKIVNKYKNNEKSLEKLLNKMKKIDFIKLYFTFLSKKYKYEIKNPLE